MMTKMKKSNSIFSVRKTKKVVAVLTCLLILLTSLMTVFSMVNSGINSGMSAGAASGDVIYYKATLGEPYAYVWGGTNGEAKAWPGEKMTLAEGETDVYKYTVPGDQTNVIFNYNKQNQTPNLTIQAGSIYSGGQWYKYNGPTEKPENSYTANLSDEVNNKIAADELYAIDATFYDYYTDTEVTNGWRESTDRESQGNWEPYTTFNGYIARYAEANDAWSYPLYFGNFFEAPDGYKGSSNVFGYNNSNWKNERDANLFPDGDPKQLYKFYNAPNNSQWLGDNSRGATHFAVQGLMDQTISNDTLTSNGVEMPFFDSAFLSDNNVGTVVETQMPLRVESSGEHELISFDSGGGKDNIWFSGYDDPSGELTMNYGAGSENAMLDSAMFYGGSDGGYGFFPFDNRTEKTRATDFGFGMKLETDFTLPTGGRYENGDPVTFSYSGDDDLWVYVDGVLVLDLGGDHQAASGSIDFSTLMATVDTGTRQASTGDVVYGTSSKAFPTLFGDGTEAFDNNDPDKVHKLTVFYMERGMSESNLKFSFNFQPISNNLKVEKEVDYSAVNTGLVAQAQTVYGAQEFDSTITYGADEASATTPANLKEYVKHDYSTDTYSNKSTGETGAVQFADKDALTFVNQFTPGEYIKIEETNASAFETSWVARDLENSNQISSSAMGVDDKVASFSYANLLGVSDFNKTSVGVVFTNKIKTGGFNLSKEVLNNDGTPAADTTEFEFTVEVKLPGETDFGTYPLTGVLTNTDSTTTDKTLSAQGTIKITDGQSVVFTGLPIGSEIKVTETLLNGYSCAHLVQNTTITDTVSNIAYTNIIEEENVVLEAYKYLNGELSTTQFDFELLDDKGNVIAEKKNDVNGKIQFNSEDTDKLSFKPTGKTELTDYVFYMREKQLAVPDDNTVYGTEVYKAVVTVEESLLTGAIIGTTTKYSVLTEGDMIGGKYTDVAEYPDVKFNNKNIGTLKVYKVDENGEGLIGAKFKLVPVTLNPEADPEKPESKWTYTQEDYDNATELEVTVKGEPIIFGNLELGDYVLIETEAPEDHQLLKSYIEVTMDVSDLNQEITVEDPGKPELPITGADITPYLIYIIAGGFILVAGGLFLIFRKRIGKVS